MKALGLCGSARRGGNTDILIREVLVGAHSQGMEMDLIYIDELNVGPCRGCTACKDSEIDCAVIDDFQAVMGKIRDASLVVIGSPVYMGQVTGQTKTFLDRLYSLRRRDRTMKIDGSAKKGVTITVCGATDPDHPEPTKKTLNVLFRFLNTPGIIDIVEQGVGKAGEIASRTQSIAYARKVGEEMAMSLMGNTR